MHCHAVPITNPAWMLYVYDQADYSYDRRSPYRMFLVAEDIGDGVCTLHGVCNRCGDHPITREEIRAVEEAVRKLGFTRTSNERRGRKVSHGR